MSSFLQSLLSGLAPSTITDGFLGFVTIMFVLLVIFRRRGSYPTATAHASAMLATLGILGTFVGIVVGLLNFDPQRLDDSIGELLEGLKTAFLSSIAGILLSLLYRAEEGFLLRTHLSAPTTDIGPEDIVSVLKNQEKLLEATRDAIAGQEESSLAGQLKMLRADLSDRRREDVSTRDRFEAELWQRLQNFAEMLSKSATQQVVEALNAVIIDFNRNLSEQFGDNFRRLDDGVHKLVQWQDRYRLQLEHLHGLYEQSIRQIKATEACITQIAEHTASIPMSMDKLVEVIKKGRHGIDELEQHLDAFAELRDRAITAVPQTLTHVENMTSDIASSVQVASANLEKLQSDSSAQQEQSRQILEQLAQAGERVKADVQAVQANVADGITQMQSRLEATLEGMLKAQRQTTDTLVQQMIDTTNLAVSRTGDGMTKQIKALDDQLEKELNRVMKQMGTALCQIAGKFVEDYRKLVEAMDQVIRMGAKQ